jgi:Tol biopolymer transport system component/DNA-binding winged helix-turn-helix (wHTH) protein
MDVEWLPPHGPFRMAFKSLKTADPIRFADDFELDLRAYELRRSGRTLKLERIPMELLILLIERRGELVTREQIIEGIWGKDVFLDTESGINAAIRKIRQVLKDDPERPRFVQTVTGKGYRFVAPVESVSNVVSIEESEGIRQVPAVLAASVAVLEPVDRSKERSKRRLLPWAVVAVGVVAAGLVLWHWWPTSPARPVVTRFTISLPPSEQFEMSRGGLAISPDGSYLVYSASTARTGAQQLYLRPMDRNEAALIPGTEGAWGPFFSPDGEWIAFTASGQLKKVPLRGGTPIVLCAKINPSTGSWGPDGTIVFTETQHWGGNENGRLMRVTAAGRDLQVVTPPEKTPTEFSPRWPQVLPRGDAILYVQGGTSAAFSDDAMIVAQSLRTGERKILIRGGTSPRYVSTGHLIYAQGGRLLAIQFDAARLEVTGNAFPVAEDVWQGPGGYAAYDVSRNGALVSMSAGDTGVGNRTLTWVEGTGTPIPINATARQYSQPSLSRDGKHIAVVIGDPWRQSDIWILDLEQNIGRQVTESQAGENAAAPLWTPDGKRIIYASGTRGRSLYWQAVDGNSPAESLFNGDLIDPSAPGMILATACSPDGRFLIFQRGDQRRFDLWMLSLSSEHKASSLFDKSDITRTYPQISPDGRRLAYTSDESGHDEIYVQPFPALGDKWQVSVGGGKEPRWSSDGHQLFFRQGDRMMAVDVQTKSTLKAERAHLLFEGSYARSGFWTNYDVAADGQRFVMLREEDEARANSVLRVVLNWADELESHSRRGSN